MPTCCMSCMAIPSCQPVQYFHFNCQKLIIWINIFDSLNPISPKTISIQYYLKSISLSSIKRNTISFHFIHVTAVAAPQDRITPTSWLWNISGRERDSIHLCKGRELWRKMSEARFSYRWSMDGRAKIFLPRYAFKVILGVNGLVAYDFPKISIGLEKKPSWLGHATAPEISSEPHLFRFLFEFVNEVFKLPE